ncbi:hypothetical protein Nhal_3995 (plasmid) [Nitrosococcus halophilus Nc 4]|uniref:Uncharacterized protein n=1 Tax=Nitrosococcus halophilus (strain Nc4) TaxID=472759 RepID=D5C5E9_NITHN|nr:hypothetical protein Nhal_3995 [Nitrosococcus halophilus Nc 4]
MARRSCPAHQPPTPTQNPAPTFFPVPCLRFGGLPCPLSPHPAAFWFAARVGWPAAECLCPGCPVPARVRGLSLPALDGSGSCLRSPLQGRVIRGCFLSPPSPLRRGGARWGSLLAFGLVPRASCPRVLGCLLLSGVCSWLVSFLFLPLVALGWWLALAAPVGCGRGAPCRAVRAGRRRQPVCSFLFVRRVWPVCSPVLWR